MERKILEKYSEILKDLNYLIRNDKIPIIRKKEERDIDHFYFKWTPVSKSNKNFVKKTSILPSSPGKNLEKNFSCKLCPKKLSAIRGFVHQGKLPILVLHYTGEIRKTGKPFIKKQNQIFKTFESEELFDRMIKKVFGVPMKDLFYQEFPGCIFNHQISTEEDWKARIQSCESHVTKTIQENNIKGIIITGSAAVLYYGMDKAKELTGKLQMKSFGESNYPFIVLRSPEGIIHLENKKKKFSSDKSSKEYLEAHKEESEVKKEIVVYLEDFKNRIGL